MDMIKEPGSIDAAFERDAIDKGLCTNPVFDENKAYMQARQTGKAAGRVLTEQMNPTPDHYNKFYKGIKIDPYRIYDLYGITNGAHQQAVKKLLRSGQGHKELLIDINETISALQRWKEMIQEELEQSPKAEPKIATLEAEWTNRQKEYATEVALNKFKEATGYEAGCRPGPGVQPPLCDFILNLISQTPGGYHYDQLCRIASRDGYSTQGLSDILDKYVAEGRVFKTPGSRYTIIPQHKRDYKQD